MLVMHSKVFCGDFFVIDVTTANHPPFYSESGVGRQVNFFLLFGALCEWQRKIASVANCFRLRSEKLVV